MARVKSLTIVLAVAALLCTAAGCAAFNGQPPDLLQGLADVASAAGNAVNVIGASVLPGNPLLGAVLMVSGSTLLNLATTLPLLHKQNKRVKVLLAQSSGPPAQDAAPAAPAALADPAPVDPSPIDSSEPTTGPVALRENVKRRAAA